MVMVIIPMSPELDPRARTTERIERLKRVFGARLVELRRQSPKASEYSLPLPWYAHENSEELRLLVEHFKPEWKDIRLVRKWDCLALIFFR